eukprot:gene5322-7387_t
MNSIIELDVGGKLFRTTKATLCNVDGYFSRMLLNDRWNEKNSTDASTPIFIDRDPLTFPSILSFLRSRRVFFTPSEDDIYLERLLIEADYYQLVELIDSVKETLTLRKLTKNEIMNDPNELEYKTIDASAANENFSRGWKYVDSFEGNETLACSVSGSKQPTTYRNYACSYCGEAMSIEKFTKHVSYVKPCMIILSKKKASLLSDHMIISDNDGLIFDQSF